MSKHSGPERVGAILDRLDKPPEWADDEERGPYRLSLWMRDPNGRVGRLVDLNPRTGGLRRGRARLQYETGRPGYWGPTESSYRWWPLKDLRPAVDTVKPDRARMDGSASLGSEGRGPLPAPPTNRAPPAGGAPLHGGTTGDPE